MHKLTANANIKYAATALVLFVTAVLFSQTGTFDFINYDDTPLIVYNSHVNTGFSLVNIKWAFTSMDMLQWVPLTWMSHMLDFQIYGNNASGHHISNIIYHLLNTAGLLYFLHKTTGKYWQSLFVAALFALHPLHVEPVAWVTARKDLLSTLFFLTTLLLYVRYVEKPGVWRYLPVLVAYLVTLMAKPMYVTLPLLLLVLDYWPLERPRFIGAADSNPRSKLMFYIAEKIPFALLAGAFSVTAYLAQSTADAITKFQFSRLLVRAATIVLSYGEYVWKTFWPAKLAVIYPLESPILIGEVLVSALALVVFTILAVKYSSAHRYLLAGWLWFLIALLPVIGIVQIGSAFLADKFTYIPIVGLFIVIAWGVPELLAKRAVKSREIVMALSAVIALSLLTARSWNYVSCWKNSETLYTEALSVTDNNFLALGNLAAEYDRQGKYDEALKLYYESIQAEPRYETGYAGIGYLYLMKGDYEKAAPFFEQALQLRPDYRRAQAGLYSCRSNRVAAQ
jgi:protein O-mannosyl-transferase